MLESLLDKAFALLQVEAEKPEGSPALRVVKLAAFPLVFKLEPQAEMLRLCARLCPLSDEQRKQIGELILVYNTQSYQSGGMRLVLGNDDVLEMHNDVVVTKWEAERLAKFIVVFSEVSAGWLKIIRETSNLAQLAAENAPADTPETMISL